MEQLFDIDFVSDVVCPWCVVGLGGLEEALRRLGDGVGAKIRVQPFELNPDMPPDGENRLSHITRKYGSTPDQARANREMIRQRAEEVGFDLRADDDSRVYNSFDAHRLLHWAEADGRQIELKWALFGAYFTQGSDIGDPEVLARAAETAGLDASEARAILASDRFAPEVRQAEQLWRERGIHSVPAIVIDGRYLISGGQPADAFETALRTILEERESRSASARR